MSEWKLHRPFISLWDFRIAFTIKGLWMSRVCFPILRWGCSCEAIPRSASYWLVPFRCSSHSFFVYINGKHQHQQFQGIPRQEDCFVFPPSCYQQHQPWSWAERASHDPRSWSMSKNNRTSGSFRGSSRHVNPKQALIKVNLISRSSDLPNKLNYVTWHDVQIEIKEAFPSSSRFGTGRVDRLVGRKDDSLQFAGRAVHGLFFKHGPDLIQTSLQNFGRAVWRARMCGSGRVIGDKNWDIV